MASKPTLRPQKHKIRLKLNGRVTTCETEPNRTLLEMIREDFGDTSPKEVCGGGNCGACTVLLDGKAVYSCLILAVECDGSSIGTVAGLGEGESLHPIQESFLSHDAYQCGYCTPGQIMSAVALLEEVSDPTTEQVVCGMSGNLCRCGAYQNILQAVLDSSKETSS